MRADDVAVAVVVHSAVAAVLVDLIDVVVVVYLVVVGVVDYLVFVVVVVSFLSAICFHSVPLLWLLGPIANDSRPLKSAKSRRLSV